MSEIKPASRESEELGEQIAAAAREGKFFQAAVLMVRLERMDPPYGEVVKQGVTLFVLMLSAMPEPDLDEPEDPYDPEWFW